MNHLTDTLRRALRNRAAYRRTVAELRAMPLDVALDLELDPTDADRIAARAVYGT